MHKTQWWTELKASYFSWFGLDLVLVVLFSFGVQLVVFFCFDISVVLVDTLGIFRCNNSLFLSSPKLKSYPRLLFLSCADSLMGKETFMQINVSNNCRSKVRSLDAVRHREGKWPPAWERVVHSVYCAYISWTSICVCASVLFAFESGVMDLIVLVPERYLFILSVGDPYP